MPNHFSPDALAPYAAKILAESESNQYGKRAAQAVESKKKGVGKAPYLAALGGLAADTATTIQALHTGGYREANPILAPLVEHFGQAGLIAAAAGEGAATTWLMHKLGTNHPTAAKVLGYIIGGGHGGAAIANTMTLKNGGKTSSKGPGPSNTPPFPGAVKCSDGSWVNPEYATCR